MVRPTHHCALSRTVVYGSRPLSPAVAVGTESGTLVDVKHLYNSCYAWKLTVNPCYFEPHPLYVITTTALISG